MGCFKMFNNAEEYFRWSLRESDEIFPATAYHGYLQHHRGGVFRCGYHLLQVSLCETPKEAQFFEIL